jgi:hypothetical protein
MADGVGGYAIPMNRVYSNHLIPAHSSSSSQGRVRIVLQSHIPKTCPDNTLSTPSRRINRPRRAGTRTIIPPRRLINNIINNNINAIQVNRTGPAVTTLTLRNMTTRSTRQNVGTRRIWTRTEVIRTINSTWPRISTTKGRGMASFTVDRVGRRWHNLRLELDQ